MSAAVPEGLPLLASVAQLSAAAAPFDPEPLVRNPRAIETMGRVDVLCFDKTGTLTTGRIGVQLVSDGVEERTVTELNPALRSVLAAAVRASPELGDDGESLPHSTDQAVVEAAERAGVTAAYGMGAWHPMGELAFEPTRRFTRWLVLAARVLWWWSRVRRNPSCRDARSGSRPPAGCR